MASWFIMAAGLANRCNGQIKQLYEIDGEPIIHHTVRLIRSVDHDPHIHVVTWRKELHIPDTTTIDTRQATSGLAESMLLSSPYWGECNCIVTGDAVFTRDAIETIWNHCHVRTCYGVYKDPKHPRGNPERFALTFPMDDIEYMEKRLRRCVDSPLRNEVPCCITDTLFIPLFTVSHALLRPINNHIAHREPTGIIGHVIAHTPLARYLAHKAPMIVLEGVCDIDTPEELEIYRRTH